MVSVRELRRSRQTPPDFAYANLVLHYMSRGYHYASLRRFLADFPPPDPVDLAYFCIEVRCLAVARALMALHFGCGAGAK